MTGAQTQKDNTPKVPRLVDRCLKQNGETTRTRLQVQHWTCAIHFKKDWPKVNLNQLVLFSAGKGNRTSIFEMMRPRRRPIYPAPNQLPLMPPLSWLMGSSRWRPVVCIFVCLFVVCLFVVVVVLKQEGEVVTCGTIRLFNCIFFFNRDTSAKCHLIVICLTPMPRIHNA